MKTKLIIPITKLDRQKVCRYGIKVNNYLVYLKFNNQCVKKLRVHFTTS
jgi:hypothetical protein